MELEQAKVMQKDAINSAFLASLNTGIIIEINGKPHRMATRKMVDDYQIAENHMKHRKLSELACKDADGRYNNCTLEQVTMLWNELNSFGVEQWSKKGLLEYKIDIATTIEEVEAVVW